jgi:outer membrane receptor protein involved in Fe transport
MLLEYDKTQANGVVTPHDGFFRDDEDGHFAEWRYILSATYAYGPWNAQVDYRFIDEVTEFGQDLVGSCVDASGATSQAGGNVGLVCVNSSSAYATTNLGDFVRTVDSASYVDVYGSYDFSEGKLVYAGIDNLFNEEPPLSVDGFNDNTDVRTFDTIGRYYYVGFKAEF